MVEFSLDHSRDIKRACLGCNRPFFVTNRFSASKYCKDNINGQSYCPEMRRIEANRRYHEEHHGLKPLVPRKKHNFPVHYDRVTFDTKIYSG